MRRGTGVRREGGRFGAQSALPLALSLPKGGDFPCYMAPTPGHARAGRCRGPAGELRCCWRGWATAAARRVRSAAACAVVLQPLPYGHAPPYLSAWEGALLDPPSGLPNPPEIVWTGPRPVGDCFPHAPQNKGCPARRGSQGAIGKPPALLHNVGGVRTEGVHRGRPESPLQADRQRVTGAKRPPPVVYRQRPNGIRRAYCAITSSRASIPRKAVLDTSAFRQYR